MLWVSRDEEKEYLPSLPTASLMVHKVVPLSHLGLASNTKDIWTVNSKWEISIRDYLAHRVLFEEYFRSKILRIIIGS